MLLWEKSITAKQGKYTTYRLSLAEVNMLSRTSSFAVFFTKSCGVIDYCSEQRILKLNGLNYKWKARSKSSMVVDAFLKDLLWPDSKDGREMKIYHQTAQNTFHILAKEIEFLSFPKLWAAKWETFRLRVTDQPVWLFSMITVINNFFSTEIRETIDASCGRRILWIRRPICTFAGRWCAGFHFMRFR